MKSCTKIIPVYFKQCGNPLNNSLAYSHVFQAFGFSKLSSKLNKCVVMHYSRRAKKKNEENTTYFVF